MNKFKSNQIKKITFEEIKLCILAPDGENDKYISITYLPTFVPSATTKRYPMEEGLYYVDEIKKRYPIAIEEGSYYVDKIKPSLLHFIEELYSTTSLGHKGIIVIGIPWHIYLSTDSPEYVNDIYDLVPLCNDEVYEKYKQKTLDDLKDAFMNFETKVYTDKDWLDAYKFEIISYFENEIKENEKMPTKDFERIEGISIVGTYNGFDGFDDFIHERKMKIDKVIFNKPATIVFWKDGTKTVVKADGEKFDPEKGLAMAISKKAYGNKGNYYDVFRKWIKGDIKGGKKKK